MFDDLVHASQVVMNPYGDADYLTRENALRNFERLLFLLGVCVAHELVHLFVGYLTGEAVPSTPPHIAYPGTGGTLVGEAGWHWESAMWGGGKLENIEEPYDPLGVRKPDNSTSSSRVMAVLDKLTPTIFVAC